MHRLPGFAASTAPWGKHYCYKAAPGLTFVVYLYPDRSTDAFTVEVGWVADASFLDANMIGPLENLDKKEPAVRLQLDRLWGERDPMYVFGIGRRPQTAYDRFDSTEEELLPEARGKAKFVVQKVIDYALPLFREVAALRGLELAFDTRPEG